MKNINEINCVSIGKAANILGVSIPTLRNWDKTGKLSPSFVTSGGTRMYDLATLNLIKGKKSIVPDRYTIAYARVSTQSQKKELETQKELLTLYCSKQGYRYKLLSDIGSSLNYTKAGLNELIELICSDQIERLVLVHKDRLLRFGSEIIFKLCNIHNVEVEIINVGDELNPNEELAKDVLEIITVFSTRLYGKRSHKSLKMIDDLKKNLGEDYNGEEEV
jgi:hypothetical protein